MEGEACDGRGEGGMSLDCALPRALQPTGNVLSARGSSCLCGVGWPGAQSLLSSSCHPLLRPSIPHACPQMAPAPGRIWLGAHSPFCLPQGPQLLHCWAWVQHCMVGL